MIAKRGPGRIRKKAPHTYGDLARYITNPEKSDRIRFTNFLSADADTIDLELAICEVISDQSLSNRSEADKTYHLIISFPTGEEPSDEAITDIEAYLCRKIGLGDHPRISALHRDTDNLHLHVAISKVHPETLRTVTPYRDNIKLSEGCREMEVKWGLARDNGLHFIDGDGSIKRDLSRKRNGRNVGPEARTLERHRGIESFQSWIAKEPAAMLRQTIVQPGATWDSVHLALARYNLAIVVRGTGLAVVDRDNPALAAKASQIARWASRAALEKRLGEFSEMVSALPVARTRYKERPASIANVERHEKRQQLYDAYLQTRNGVLANRRIAWQEIRERGRSRRAEIIEASRQRRQEIRCSAASASEKKIAYKLAAMDRASAEMQLRHDLARDRLELRTGRTENFRTFVQARAQDGDEAALEVLRTMRARTQEDQETVNAIRPVGAQSHDAILRSTAYRVDRHGDITYTIAGRDALVDRGKSIRVIADGDPATVELGLRLARQKYGRELTVHGSDEFKRLAVETAVREGIDVRFKDSQLEAYRRQLEIDRKTPAPKPQVRDPVPQEELLVSRPEPPVQPAVPAELDAYLARRNALVGVAAGVVPHRLPAPDEAINGHLQGIRNVGDSQYVLVENATGDGKRREILVVRIRPEDATRLKQRGARVVGRQRGEIFEVESIARDRNRQTER